jgi:hypothetical protein
MINVCKDSSGCGTFMIIAHNAPTITLKVLTILYDLLSIDMNLSKMNDFELS